MHTTVEGIVFGHNTLQAAYNHLVDSNDWDDGDWKHHGGGAIPDAYLTTPILSDDTQACIAAEEALADRVESYGYALGVPVRKVKPARYEKVRTATLTAEFVTADLDSRSTSGLSDLGRKKVAKALGMKVDEIGDIYRNYESPLKQKFVFKYKAETGEGKAQTRYFVIPMNESMRMPDWTKGFATQAEARASVNGTKEFNTEFTTYGGSEFEIVGMIRREDGGALVRSKSVVAKATFHLKVDIRRKVSEREVTDEYGWLIVGSVHI